MMGCLGQSFAPVPHAKAVRQWLTEVVHVDGEIPQVLETERERREDAV